MPPDRVNELFEARAAEGPDAPAVAFSGRQITYGELNRRANRLAHHLIVCGVRPETLVGLCMERSPQMLVGLLAILKAGGAYLPLDPAHPRDRLSWMLEDAGVSLLVTRTRLKDRIRARWPLRVIDLDADRPLLARQPTANPVTAALPENLVYCIYTSGSTGRPKGVAVAGSSLLNHVDHMAGELRIGPRDRVLQFTSIGIDAALEEIFPAWARGAALVLPHQRVPSADQLLRLLQVERVSVISLPSTYWHHWLDALAGAPRDRPAALRLVFVGGERLLAEKLRRWHALGWSREVAWIADYGPTEATISCATFSGEPAAEWRNVPLGRPISNTAIYLLDPGLSPVPAGATGELYIAGAGLARGYLARAGLTAERFLPDPFAGPGGRMYRTGDLGQMLADGNIQFAGRIDDQVKILGHRIELGEVEAAIRRCDGVREVVVVVREEVAGDPRLIAYVVAEGFSEAVLRRELEQQLPAVMIPAVFVPLERLPISAATAKVERSRLPSPARGSAPPEAGGSGLERSIAGIFEELAGAAPRSLDEGFFASGGDSLRALRLLGRLADAARVEVSFAELQQASSVRALSALLLRRWSGGEEELVARLRNGHAPRRARLGRGAGARRAASHAQQRLWFLNKLQAGAPTYSVPFGYRVRGELSVDALDAALTRIVARHEALRTALVEHPAGLRQEIAPPMPIRSRRASAPTFAEALRLAHAEAGEPFDLASAPLLRSLCVRVQPDEHLLVLNFHHSAFDAWSLGIFWRELGALYAEDGVAPPPEPAFHYADYTDWQADWLAGTEAQRQRAFWCERLAGDLPVLRLGGDLAPAATPSIRGALAGVRVAAEQAQAIGAVARRLGTTEFVVMLAGFFATLHRTTRQDQVVVGVPVACRSPRETEGIIGCLTNTVALRLDFPPGLRFARLVEETSRALCDALANQELPFDEVVDALPLPREPESNPVFQAMFVLQSTPMDEALRLGGLDVGEVTVHSGTAKVDLTCALRATADGFEGELEYATRIFDRSAARRWVESFETLLAGAALRPDARVDEIAMLCPREGEAIIAKANASFEVYSGLQPLHAAFEAQARRHPEAIAIEVAGEVVRYGELEGRSSRLARALIAAGAAPERHVGVCIERSVDMVVAILAVLKSGAAFVPLDPRQPLERLRAIAEDADLLLVLAQPASAPRLAALPAPVVPVTAQAGDVAQPGRAVSLANLAYVYYTSGSTGVPKGVPIDHRCAMNRLEWLKRRYPLAVGDRVVHKTPLIFDVAIWEIFGPLHAGATLLMADPGAEADVQHVGALMATPRTVFVHFVPSMLDAYLSHARRRPYPDLRWVQVSGEAMPSRVLERFTEHCGAELHNLYGQTETSEVAGWEGRSGATGSRLPIGGQLGIYRLFVLDAALAPVPPAVPGELCVAGRGGLARGYHRRPDLTAERFVPNPHAVAPGERLYRTGDLACVDPSGLIRYLGRTDEQTKIRGCRVETGEVESVLARHGSVRACAVVARQDDEGANQLIAYVVGDRLASGELAAHAERLLPSYMLPAAYTYLTALPRTASGKLDRRALPAPTARDREARVSGEAPRGPLEPELAELWKQTLGLGKVGRRDSFFGLGGNSLKCLQVLSRVNAAFGVQVSVRDFFAAPTLAGLASAIEQATVEMVLALPEDEVERRLAGMSHRAPDTRPDLTEPTASAGAFAPPRTASTPGSRKEPDSLDLQPSTASRDEAGETCRLEEPRV